MSSTHDIQAILEQAATCPAGEIAGLLDRECGSNTALRAEVESLLHSVTAAGRFMASPTASPNERAIDHGGLLTESRTSDAEEALGVSIGPYKLLQRIGEGGFGTVYMAEQESPVWRKVALKIIKLGMDTRQVIARFEAERQALAMMDHPNIARVLDAGATDSQSPLGAGRPYFVMELVRGVPITRFCDENRLTVKQRLELFGEVCRAVQHAHTKGIIHRDIKPSNVMVTLDDDRPLPKVIDFGIAKATGAAVRLTDKTLFTEYQQFIGTPEYMSPEQTQMNATDVDTRSDIYSLGVLLYELLTGVTPFDQEKLRGASLDDVRRIITEVQPPTPSTRLSAMRSSLSEPSRRTSGSGSGLRDADPKPLPHGRGSDQGSSAADIAGFRGHDEVSLARTLRGDLDWIVMKCLEKDRTRRYETANGLAMDVGRYLTNEPVEAGPLSRLYLAKKFVQRNRTAVIAASLVAGAMVLGMIGTSAGLIWALSEADRANKAEDQADQRASQLAQRAEEIGRIKTLLQRNARRIRSTNH